MLNWITGLAAILASVTAVLASVWILFSYADKIVNWKARRDINKNLRKDLHIMYAKSIDSIMKDVDKNGKIIDDNSLINLIALIQSASGAIKGKRFKKQLFNKEIIVNQLKNINRDGIKDNFYLNKSITLFDVFGEEKLSTDINKYNNKDAIKLLILIATVTFTEQASVIKYDDKYKAIVNKIENIHKIPSKELLRLIKVNKLTKVVKLDKIGIKV